jgi:hypothetical protein
VTTIEVGLVLLSVAATSAPDDDVSNRWRTACGRMRWLADLLDKPAQDPEPIWYRRCRQCLKLHLPRACAPPVFADS